MVYPLRCKFRAGLLSPCAPKDSGRCPWVCRDQRESALGTDRSIQAAGRKLQHRIDLFTRDVELFHQFFNGHSILEVFKDGGYRQTCTTETHAPLTLPGMLSTAAH